MSDLDTSIELFGEKLSIPTILARIGACGMYARRGEVQAAQEADNKGVQFPFQPCHFPFNRVNLPRLRKLRQRIKRPMWFQLYVLKDRGFMKNALERAKATGCSTALLPILNQMH